VRLYFFPVAPNPTKVRVYLSEKGLEVPQELVNLREGEQRRPGFLSKNPMGKLPVLELDDGTLVSESLAIIEYFEETHPEPSLWGPTPAERARTRTLERLCDIGVLQCTARFVHATNSPLGLPANPAVADDAREFLQRSLAVLDGEIGEGPLVAGDRVSVADCTLFAALNFGRFFDLKLDRTFANVSRWWERFQQRPSASLGSPP
jgi:glutathione S-transferase